MELSIGRSVSTVVQALGHFPFSQNFRFENLAVSLVDQKSKSDGARSYNSISATSRNGNFCANGRGISVSTVWNAKSGVPLMVVRLFREISI